MNPQDLSGFAAHNFGQLADWLVTPCEFLLTADIGGETILLHRKTTGYFTTNEVGAFIWSLLKCPTWLGAIRDAVTAEFSVPSAACEADLMEYIAALVAEDLVSIAPGAG